MKLLFDQNTSPKLAKRLADLFPSSTHVENVALDRADDVQVWEYARQHDYVIVSKDEDFDYLSVQRGTPPKFVWLQLGNCTTAEIEAVFRDRYADIEAFGRDPSLGTIVLG